MTKTRRNDFPKLLSNEVLGFDKFGFAIFQPGQNVDTERHHVYKRRVYPKEETLAWERLFEEWDEEKNKNHSKVHTYLRRGVPLHMRSKLWKELLCISTLKSTIKFNYQEELGFLRRQLVDLGISEYGGESASMHLSELEMDSYKVRFDDISMDALRHIFLDLERSYPSHRMFMGNTPEAKEGRASLFRVLATYARYNRKVEYCQGMASIAGMFLMQMDDEEEAFWCLLSLLERQKYVLGYFDNSMDRLKDHTAVFDQLLSQRFPKLQRHLTFLGINPLMYLTPWFMVLYANLPCWDTVLAIWDLLLIDGNKTIFQVALSLLEVFEEDCLKMKDICDVLPGLLHLPVKYIEYDTLMPVVWSTYIEDWEISSLLADLCCEDAPLSPGTPAKMAAPASGQKRKRSADGNPKVVRFTGEEDKRKRLKSSAHDKPSPSPIVTKPIEEVSVFKRFVNMFTPKTEDAISPRPKSALKTRKTNDFGKRRSLRRSRHSRDHLLVPDVADAGNGLNIDKRISSDKCGFTKQTDSKPAAPGGGIFGNKIVVPEISVEISCAGLSSREPCTDHPLKSLPSSVENSPVETKDNNFLKNTVKNARLYSLKIPSVGSPKRSPNLSPCAVADENSFIEHERLAALKLTTPVRRSPRLMKQRALRDVNGITISEQSVVSLSTRRHSFQHFKSATPFRRSSMDIRVSTPPFVSSPVVELRSLRWKKMNPIL